jgi:transcriptional regulator with XRE-family HTH domain
MSKSSTEARRAMLATLLKDHRVKAGLRQIDVAEKLGEPQSFVSKYEIGERRLDLVELVDVCSALGLSLRALVDQFEKAAAK